MPRVGSRPEEQSVGGLFSFTEGWGMVVDAKVGNHTIPGYDTNCGYKLSIQRVDPITKAPTADPPVVEFLPFGKAEYFHPGLAKSSDDQDPELEWNARLDLGPGDEAEGTCVICASRGPDAQTKIRTFTDSGIEQGIRKDLFNGYAPNLIGLVAHFTQKMLQRPKNSTAKNDPTCLIIGRGGQPVPAERLVYKYPDAQTGQTGQTNTAQPQSPAQTAAPRSTPPPPANATDQQPQAQSQSQPVNGSPAPAATAAPAPVSFPSPVSEEISDEALAMKYIPAVLNKAAKPLTRKQIATRMLTMMVSDNISSKRHPGIQKYVKTDDAWFNEFADDQGWKVEGAGEVAVVTPGQTGAQPTA